jgi:hypothetical protein
MHLHPRVVALLTVSALALPAAGASAHTAGASAASCSTASLTEYEKDKPGLQLKSVVDRLRQRGFKQFRARPVLDNVLTCPKGRMVARATAPATKTRKAFLLAKVDETFSFCCMGRASFKLTKTKRGTSYLKKVKRARATVSIHLYDAEGAAMSYSRTITLKD